MRQYICNLSLSFSFPFLAGHLRHHTCHLGKGGSAILMVTWSLDSCSCGLLSCFYRHLDRHIRVCFPENMLFTLEVSLLSFSFCGHNLGKVRMSIHLVLTLGFNVSLSVLTYLISSLHC